MKEVHAGDSMPARVRSGSPAVLLAVLIVASSVIPLLDSATAPVAAESLPSWSKIFRMHEGVPTTISDYDWLNTSDPQNPGDLDYDGDGLLGVTIRKNLPSARWRHFWALDPEVNQDVRISGDVDFRVWAASRDNESASVMTVTLSDIAPGQWATPDSWTTIGTASTPLLGPFFSAFKPYNLTVPSVNYTLLDGHRLVLTIMRGDSLNDGLLVLYDDDYFDSYITVPVLDFVSVSEVRTEDTEGTQRDTFSDTEPIVVVANVTNPFGTYETAPAECTVAYSSNGTVVLPRSAMSTAAVDPSADSSWVVFSHAVGPLGSGTYTVTVNGSDAHGSPTWMNVSVSVVAVDHFQVTAPASVTAGVDFEMTVTALDSLDAVITNWRGTVVLEPFDIDMVTPKTEPLSNSTVEFDGTEGGTVTITDQVYDVSEDVIVIRASSNGHYGWSDQVAVFAGPVVSISIDPTGPLDIDLGGSELFTVTGYDSLGHENHSWTPEWSLDGDIGTLDATGFTATLHVDSAGTATVGCEDPASGANVSVDVTVAAGSLYRIELVPAGPITIKEGQSITITAVGYDSYDNVVPLSSPIWFTNTSGHITGTGSSVLYTAGFIPEAGVVTVSAGLLSASVQVTVTNALNGPWLSTIPAQIANEDTSWSLSLASYWNHVNGTSGLRWYVDGVDNSLYIVTFDPASTAMVLFMTQPDKFGTDTFRLWVRDLAGYSTYQDVVVSIQPVNDRPVFVHSPPTEYYVKFDMLYSFDFAYYVSDVDNPPEELSMYVTSSEWGSVVFDGFIASFLFTEKDGTESYFETMKVTLTDAPSSMAADSTNSAYLSIVVWVTDDTPPDLTTELPDIPDLLEGEMYRLVFDLDDYFEDVDEDILIYKTGFLNIVVDINKTTHEVRLSAPYEWSGVTDGTFTAVDPTGAFKTDTVTVTVIPVNDAPSVSSPGAIHVRYDVEYRLDAGLYVSDPDHSFAELTFAFDSPYVTYSGGDILLMFPADLSGGAYAGSYNVDVEMWVVDPEGEGNWGNFTVTVSDNYPPAVVSPVPYPDIISFPEDGYLNGTLDLDMLFYDVDDTEHDYMVKFGSEDEKVRVTIYEDGSVNFSAEADWSGYEVVEFKCLDSHLAWASWSVTVVVTPVNDAPVVAPIGDKELAGWPRNFQMMVIQYFSDKETPEMQLNVTATPAALVSAVGEYLYVSMPGDLDEISVTIYVEDEEGARSNSVTFTIALKKTTADTIGYPYSLPLVVLAAGVAGFFAASRLPRPYALENLFLIHNDGRLVAHVTRQENMSIDKDVVSAMFTAVQEFVRDSFQAGEVGLKKLEIGDKNVLIEKGKSVYVAMIYSGWPPKGVFEAIPMLLRDVEERYGERLERWNGTMKSVKGVEGMLLKFMSDEFEPGSWVTEEEIREEEWVDILTKES